MPHTERIKYVLLDVDDTLLDFGWAERNALTKAFAEFGIELDDREISEYSEINSRQWEKLERGELTREQILVSRFEIFLEWLGIDDVNGMALQLRYEKLLGIGHKFIDGAEELLGCLYGEYELFIVSNGTASVQAGRLKSAGIGRYFKNIFISEEIGFDKPKKEFFDACFEQIPDFEREKAIIVGDRISSDITGGVNAGIKTCWFNPKYAENNTEISPDYEIHNLSELPELLRSI